MIQVVPPISDEYVDVAGAAVHYVAWGRPGPQDHYLPYVLDHVARRSLRQVEGGWRWKFDRQVFAQFVSAVVDGGLDVATAVAAPRWAADVEVHLGSPTRTAVESRYHAGVVDGLSLTSLLWALH